MLFRSAESTELASHARHAGTATEGLGTFLGVWLESQWFEELASFSSLDVDFSYATDLESSWMSRIELWLVVESENMRSLGPWIELIA